MVNKENIPKVLGVLAGAPGLHTGEIVKKLGGLEAPFNTMEYLTKKGLVTRTPDKKGFMYYLPKPAAALAPAPAAKKKSHHKKGPDGKYLY